MAGRSGWIEYLFHSPAPFNMGSLFGSSLQLLCQLYYTSPSPTPPPAILSLSLSVCSFSLIASRVLCLATPLSSQPDVCCFPSANTQRACERAGERERGREREKIGARESAGFEAEFLRMEKKSKLEGERLLREKLGKQTKKVTRGKNQQRCSQTFSFSPLYTIFFIFSLI